MIVLLRFQVIHQLIFLKSIQEINFFCSATVKCILFSRFGMVLLVGQILRRRRLSVCRKRVEIIALSSFDTVCTCSSCANEEIVSSDVRSGLEHDFGIEESAFVNAPLHNLERNFMSHKS